MLAGAAILTDMPLFEVDRAAKTVSRLDPTTFPDLRLWERQDLEAWVAASPELAGGDFAVVTSEFDRFDRTNGRLDLLGIVQVAPGVGRLVVVELKRDGSSTTVDLQAIKYAAYVAASVDPKRAPRVARNRTRLTRLDRERRRWARDSKRAS